MGLENGKARMPVEYSVKMYRRSLRKERKRELLEKGVQLSLSPSTSTEVYEIEREEATYRSPLLDWSRITAPQVGLEPEALQALFTGHTDQPSQVSDYRPSFLARGAAALRLVFHLGIHPD